MTLSLLYSALFYSEIPYVSLLGLSFSDSLIDLYTRRTFDIRSSSATQLLPSSPFLRSMLVNLKYRLPSSLIYYFALLYSHYEVFRVIELAVKVATVKTLLIDSLEENVVREVSQGAKIVDLVEVDAMQAVKKGVAHAGERNNVIIALKIAKTQTSKGKINQATKHIE